MKTMRNAFLAATVLAALTVSASAQTVSDIDTEISFIGQVDVLLARRVTTGAVFAPNAGNPFNPRTDLPLNLAAYGFIEGGQLFTPPAVTGATSLFTPGGTGARNARYTFSVTNLMLNPASVQTSQSPGPFGALNVQAQFSGGDFEIFFDANGGGVAGDLQDFSESSQASFRNGTRILFGDIDFLQSNYTVPNNTTRPSTGLLDGTIRFNTALGSGPINQFLIDNPAFAAGFIANTGFSTSSRVGFGEFGTTGQIELVEEEGVIPEPATMALFGAGLLPLGAFLRRRRGA